MFVFQLIPGYRGLFFYPDFRIHFQTAGLTGRRVEPTP